MLLSVVLISATTLFIFFYYFTRNFKYWNRRNVKCPKPVSLFRNLLDSVLRRKHVGDIFHNIYKQYPEEKYVGCYKYASPYLLIRDPDLIRLVMIKDFDAFCDRGTEVDLGSWSNLVQAESDTWSLLRNKFTPFFTPSKLKNMTYLVIKCSEQFLDYMQEISKENKEHEVCSIMKKYTISTIAATTFSLDIKLGDKLMSELDKIDKTLFNFSFFHALGCIIPGIRKLLRPEGISTNLALFFRNLVETTKVERNNKPTNRKDFMDLMLELRQKKTLKSLKINQDDGVELEITDQIMAAQAFVFYVAGYETSALTMSFLLYELAHNLDIQNKLIKEIDEVLTKYNGNWTYDTLQEMKYLSQVFNETLRIYPIGPYVQRKAMRNYQVPDTDLIIKKGEKVLVSITGIHHDQKYYPNPNKFDPERFSIDNIGKRHPCAYLPFGLGPRICIGMRLAQIQTCIGIAKLLSKYRVEPAKSRQQNLKFDPCKADVIQFTGGTYLNFVPRNK